MNKLKRARYELQHMDELAERDQWVNEIHPLVKLVLTVFYISITVSCSKYDLGEILRMGCYPIVIFILGELSFRDCLRRLRVILPLVCLVGICNPFFERQPMAFLGGLVIVDGIISALSLICKGIYCVLASYLLIATTSMESICYALRLLHIPSILVTQILLTYRYISVLLREAEQMMQSYTLRAPGQRGVHFRVWGSLAGQLLLRSVDRAKAVYESMILRGYHGEFYSAGNKKAGIRDILYLVAWCGVLGVLRIL